MFLVAAFAILVAMAMALVRACLGPTAQDRMLASSNIGAYAVLLIAVAGSYLEWNSFVDIALLYAMVSFVTTIAIMRFFDHDQDSEPESTQPQEEGS
ncbi:MAG: monovalent cation/H+ antiporter complex subunit F [Planctomycetota bacterium]